MREIDQALARGYGASPSPTRGTPPSPPAPHFAVEAGADPAPPRSGEPLALSWPETVRALERDHGERFAQLAEALLDARDRRNVRVVLFTSSHRAEGRTTLVLTLARALARHPGRTLLADGDLSGPMLARLLGLRPRLGLDDVVERGQAAADAWIEAPDDHLTILPLRAPVARPREFLESSGWSCLMNRLRREFDLVLVDGGPLFSGPSAAVLPGSVDAAVLVRHGAIGTDRSLTRAREALDAGGVPLLGIAETFC